MIWIKHEFHDKTWSKELRDEISAYILQKQEEGLHPVGLFSDSDHWMFQEIKEDDFISKMWMDEDLN